MNRTTIIGKLSKDPEFQDRGNFKVVRLSLWHSRYAGKDPQTQQPKYEFENFDVELQNDKKVAAFMQLGLKKGSKLFVECSQQSSKGVDRQTNQPRTYKHLVVNEFHVMADVEPQDGQQPGYQQQQQQPQGGYQQPQQPQGGYQQPQPQYGAPAPQYAAPAPQYQQPAPASFPAPPQQPMAPVPPPAQFPPQQPQYAAPAPPQGFYQPPAGAPGPVPVPQPAQPPQQFNGGQAAPF